MKFSTAPRQSRFPDHQRKHDMADIDELRDYLRLAADGLADLAMDTLRAAMRTRDDDERNELKAKEKRITRARRSVEKAISLVDGRE